MTDRKHWNGEPPAHTTDVAAEDFHIFYDSTLDSLMVKFYGNGMRPSVHDPIDRIFEALRDPGGENLTGINITGFVRTVLPELLQIGAIAPTIGHIHVEPYPIEPLDALADEALRQHREGKKVRLRDYAAEQGVNLDAAVFPLTWQEAWNDPDMDVYDDILDDKG